MNTSSTMKAVQFKVNSKQFGIPVPDGLSTIPQLLHCIQIYQVDKHFPKTFEFSYKDQEGDEVSITNDGQLEEFLSQKESVDILVKQSEDSEFSFQMDRQENTQVKIQQLLTLQMQLQLQWMEQNILTTQKIQALIQSQFQSQNENLSVPLEPNLKVNETNVVKIEDSPPQPQSDVKEDVNEVTPNLGYIQQFKQIQKIASKYTQPKSVKDVILDYYSQLLYESDNQSQRQQIKERLRECYSESMTHEFEQHLEHVVERANERENLARKISIAINKEKGYTNQRQTIVVPDTDIKLKISWDKPAKDIKTKTILKSYGRVKPPKLFKKQNKDKDAQNQLNESMKSAQNKKQVTFNEYPEVIFDDVLGHMILVDGQYYTVD